MYIIRYTQTKELGKRITPDIYMIIYMTEGLMNKMRKITPEKYMTIYMTENIINKRDENNSNK